MSLFGLNPYVAGGIALIVAGALTFGGCEHHNAGVAREKLKAVEVQRDIAIDANKSNVTTIDTQKAALAKWAAIGVSPEEYQAHIAEVLKLKGEMQQSLAAFNEAKEKDRANPDCQAILSTDFERACPLVALGLRDVARGHKDGAGGDPGPRRETAPRRAPGGLRAAVPLPAAGKPEG